MGRKSHFLRRNKFHFYRLDKFIELFEDDILRLNELPYGLVRARSIREFVLSTVQPIFNYKNDRPNKIFKNLISYYYQSYKTKPELFWQEQN